MASLLQCLFFLNKAGWRKDIAIPTFSLPRKLAAGVRLSPFFPGTSSACHVGINNSLLGFKVLNKVGSSGKRGSGRGMKREHQAWLAGPLPEVKWELWGRRALERVGLGISRWCIVRCPDWESNP